MKRGDIVIVRLPDQSSSDPGREQRGRRPAVILQDQSRFGNLPTVVVAPITSTIGALRFNGTLRINPSSLNGLETPSVLLVFQSTAVDRNRIERQIGRLEEETQKRMDEILHSLILPVCPVNR